MEVNRPNELLYKNTKRTNEAVKELHDVLLKYAYDSRCAYCAAKPCSREDEDKCDILDCWAWHGYFD